MSRPLPFIKICGQTHTTSVDYALITGARFIGFIFHRSSPRSISPERAAGIHTGAAKRVGVFVRQSAGEILDTIARARLDYVQLHGKQTPDDALRIGPERVIRVLWPESCETPAALQRQLDTWAPFCAYYLLDAGQTGQAGGLGRLLNASDFDKLRFPHPWILAGGLSADNLERVLAQCTPDGVDLNSGVEIFPGLKDLSLIFAAQRAIRRARS
ncbi:MAG: phosphoribosylanthranilate isomerase [Akkermansiaceae bacterium]|nr:phosphoribosylanthranilate isomerase [Akkermansiaceae bacterium]